MAAFGTNEKNGRLRLTSVSCSKAAMLKLRRVGAAVTPMDRAFDLCKQGRLGHTAKFKQGSQLPLGQRAKLVGD
jgi:hypothetical protein